MPSEDIARSEYVLVTVRQIDHVNGSESVISQYEKRTGYNRRQRVSGRTPGWRTNPAVRSDPPMNPLFFQKTMEAIAGTERYRTKLWNVDGELYRDDETTTDGPPTAYTGGGSAGSFPGSDELVLTDRDISVTDDRAVTKTLLGMKDQKVNVAQAAAERLQTTKLLEGTVRKVATAVTQLRRGNWNGAVEALGVPKRPSRQSRYKRRHDKNPDEAVASAWLELQYGWRPLFSDVYGSAELLAQKNSRVVYERTRKRHVLNKEAEGVLTVSDLQTVSIKASRKYAVTYTLYFATPQQTLHTATQVGITNPALVAWELVPWSFVVDWFLPIGNYISSWDATLGLEFKKGMKTVSDEYTETLTHVGGVRGSQAEGSYSELKTDVTSSYSQFSVTCTPLAGMPSPRLPSLKNPISLEHAGNAIALLIQVFQDQTPSGKPNRPGTSDRTRPVRDWYDWGKGRRS